ncbi:hypothetical protein, partial [Franconibacter pulveris]|uniref:hypothetical protein n=1 Tax=Franconibacter pulveris TaxID=435910 RepID=UPI001F2E429A
PLAVVAGWPCGYYASRFFPFSSSAKEAHHDLLTADYALQTDPGIISSLFLPGFSSATSLFFFPVTGWVYGQFYTSLI